MTYAKKLKKHRQDIITLKFLGFTCSDIHYLITKYYFTNISYKAITRYISTFTYVESIPDFSKAELNRILLTHKSLISNRRVTYHKKSKLFKYRSAILGKYSISNNINKILKWLIKNKKINVTYSTLRRFILKSGAPLPKKSSIYQRHAGVLLNKFKQCQSYTKTHIWFVELTGLRISYSTVRRLIYKV